VSIRRALAGARLTPDLATSLNTLANTLSKLGRREEALAAAQEAASIRRALAGARPEAFTPNLAVSLNTLANRLSQLGRREEALAAAQEAAELVASKSNKRRLRKLRLTKSQPRGLST
jgi:tetratricopeptide (TPR) repeat protein